MSYLGSIGFGYPAALGAWAAAYGCPAVAVAGDGAFGQYAELTTAVEYGIPVKHVLLHNHSLGKISKEQLAADFLVWHTSLHNPDWTAYAELCGAIAQKIPSAASPRADPNEPSQSGARQRQARCRGNITARCGLSTPRRQAR